jgi:hypothetical protein
MGRIGGIRGGVKRAVIKLSRYPGLGVLFNDG